MKLLVWKTGIIAFLNSHILDLLFDQKFDIMPVSPFFLCSCSFCIPLIHYNLTQIIQVLDLLHIIDRSSFWHNLKSVDIHWIELGLHSQYINPNDVWWFVIRTIKHISAITIFAYARNSNPLHAMAERKRNIDYDFSSLSLLFFLIFAILFLYTTYTIRIISGMMTKMTTLLVSEKSIGPLGLGISGWFWEYKNFGNRSNAKRKLVITAIFLTKYLYMIHYAWFPLR